MNPISVQQVIKEYRQWTGKIQVLKGVDLEVQKGRIFGLLGPNGAGKTSLIKLILGLSKPTAGKVELFGSSTMGPKQKERLGFLPEENYLYNFLTVRESIESVAGMYTKKIPSSKIDSVIEEVGMKDFQRRKISECSKGMARRTALAQCLVHDPELVILDEPMSGFDPIGIADIRRLMAELKAQGRTVLVCSHMLADIEGVVDDIAILLRGKVIVQGAFHELLEGGVREGLSVDEKNRDQLYAWLLEKQIAYERIPTGRLEHFFIEQLKTCGAYGAN